MKKYNKNLRIARNGLAAAALAAATLTFTGCLFSPPEPEEPEPPPEMTTPANVLKNIETAYNQKLIENYKKALSSNFVFYFDPDDVGQEPPGKPEYKIPESWSYTEDWGATYNMFQKAYSINLTIPTGNVGEPGPNDDKFRADNISINLIVMVDELNGYQANQGFCNFEFEKYKNQEGQDRWRLRKWWDFTAEPTA